MLPRRRRDALLHVTSVPASTPATSAQAAKALGRPHRLDGIVVRGDRRGRQLGFPTANVRTDRHAAIPADGVYAGLGRAAPGKRLPAAISVGTNPTFAGRQRTVEAYILDFDERPLRRASSASSSSSGCAGW